MNSIDTLAVHGGRTDLSNLGAHVPPIDLSTTYPLPDVELGGAAYETLASGGRPLANSSLVYQRLWNPTVARFEEALAGLEGTAASVSFSSGMAALTACLLAAAATGHRHIVAVRPLYGGTDHLLTTGLLGTEVSWATADTIAAALRPDTGLVIVETPANPTLELVDIADIVAAAGDIPVLVDNTFATPILQQPARHGAALVLHSATKYLGGHGDVIGGVVACDETWATRLRSVRAITGGLLHPLGGYLLHRGLQTLPVRVRAQQDAAVKVADALSTHEHIAKVYYPGLCDERGLIGRQMTGPGAVLAFAVHGGYEAAARVAASCRLITHAVSLGGVDTLIQHPAALTHRPVSADAKPHPNVLRVSVGLEDPADIIDDLLRALSDSSSAGTR